MKNIFISCLVFVVSIFICCKDKSKREQSVALIDSTKIITTADTILKRKEYFFGNKILYLIEWKYSENNPKSTTYYIDQNHEKVLEYEDNPLLIKDTVFDINKDGLKDLVLLYQTTGPVQYHVYLFNKIGLVDKEIETYNYFPINEKEFIQAVNFRSPIVELKKLKWRGTDIDTIEKIYYDSEHPVYYQANKYPFKDFEPKDEKYSYDSTVKVKILKKLPDDYIKAIKKYYPELINP
ncbi:hypothetical protein [[Flexibacter] sp. ATCC 35103]|uniref:hypothetical protein n=1 Tax=[Flexibacter] sp. ATCC 35103 TaxID=1937528 RepID=UPI0009CC2FC7|nr:hypothetical protein [[Flexibacter] sp. ATCC 35103]OMQ13545.1 hypothetical protein BXU01_03445 [[Flexibacter] sp. ATCC 35103]